VLAAPRLCARLGTLVVARLPTVLRPACDVLRNELAVDEAAKKKTQGGR